jgi:hypothetical protein
MQQRLSHIEARLAAVERQLSLLEEARTPPVPSLIASDQPERHDPELPFSVAAVPEAALLLGRSLVVLAGAYLLRALTATGYWPARWGVFAGLSYATLWLLLCDRDGTRRHLRSAAFHGVGACVIAFPLLWESRTFLQATSDGGVAVLWAAFAVLTFVVARRSAVVSVLAALVFVGGPIGVALIPATNGSAPVFASVLSCVAAATTVSWPMEGAWLLWVPVLLADGLALVLGLFALAPHAAEWLAPERVAAAQWLGWAAFAGLALPAGWRGTRRAGGPLFQEAFLLALVASSVALPWDTAASRRFVALGVALAGIAHARHADQSPAGRTMTRWLGLAVFVLGSGVALPDPPRSLIWAALALAAVALADRHATSCAAVAFGGALAWSSGLLPGMAEMEAHPIRSLVAADFVLGICAWRLTRRGEDDTGRFVASATLIALACAGSMAVGLRTAAAVLPAGVFDVVGPSVPMLAALLLLALSRRTRDRQSRWAAIGAMLGAAGHVTLVDVLAGTPERQVAGFATLGTALFGATLLLRAPSTSANAPPADATA